MPKIGFHGSCSTSSRVIPRVGSSFCLEARYSVVSQLHSVLVKSRVYVRLGLLSSVLWSVTSSKSRSGDFLELSPTFAMFVFINTFPTSSIQIPDEDIVYYLYPKSDRIPLWWPLLPKHSLDVLCLERHILLLRLAYAVVAQLSTSSLIIPASMALEPHKIL